MLRWATSSRAHLREPYVSKCSTVFAACFGAAGDLCEFTSLRREGRTNGGGKCDSSQPLSWPLSSPHARRDCLSTALPPSGPAGAGVATRKRPIPEPDGMGGRRAGDRDRVSSPRGRSPSLPHAAGGSRRTPGRRIA
ncbi:hypothetical protein THAOC_17826, partial [Thalassiosira oceanica]